MTTTQVRLGDGELAAVGDEVALHPEFESLADHPTYGVIRTLESFRDAENWQVYKVGVLWFGYGGIWVRHYLSEQLVRMHHRVKSAGPQFIDGTKDGALRKWEVVGAEADEAETTKRTWEGDIARPAIRKALELADAAERVIVPQQVLAETLNALRTSPEFEGEPDEQLVRDVVTEELALRAARAHNQKREGGEAGHSRPLVIVAMLSVLAVLILAVSQGNLNDTAVEMWEWLIEPFVHGADGT